ncbi:MAG: thermonuclease family protein [Actinobacteria bacterium]|nr:thermonuclease family protein [Actinomycetota bacterium]
MTLPPVTGGSQDGSMRRIPRLIVFAFALALAGCGDSATDGPPDEGRVTNITDGDTIRVQLNTGPEEKVRLIGIDTPEVHGRGGLRECFGKEASAEMGRLLPLDTTVRLEIDAEPRDRYGRLLAYVYRVDDDLHVNLEMARRGFAAPLTIPPNVAFADAFVEAAAEARDASRGLWSACGGPDKPL